MGDETRMAAGRAVLALLDGAGATGLRDSELLERLQDRGSLRAEAAGSALMARHGPMVRRVCLGILGDHHLANDAFQTTFLILIEKAGRIRDPEGLPNWLHGVAARVARSLKASEARRRRLDAARASAVLAAHSQATGDGDRVRREIGRLPDRFRDVIALHHLEELGCEEISARLGVPTGTVKSRLSRGRALLRSRLAREFEDGFLSPGILAFLRWTGIAVLAASAVIWVGVGGFRSNPGQIPPFVAALQSKPGEPSPASKPAIRKIASGDVLAIEFAESLPGRPITGKFPVDSGGAISLATYGTLKVAGLTIDEARSAMIRRMWDFLSDEDLGVRTFDPETGEGEELGSRKNAMVFVDFDPGDSNAVFVLGDVASPGRHPLGPHGLTVLDILNQAGGIRSEVDRTRITLTRRAASAPPHDLTVRLAEIMKGDASTNYRLEREDVLKIRSMPPPGKTKADELTRQAREIERLRKRISELEEEIRSKGSPRRLPIR